MFVGLHIIRNSRSMLSRLSEERVYVAVKLAIGSFQSTSTLETLLQFLFAVLSQNCQEEK